MKSKVLVIRDAEGNYISARETELGWFYLTYTGDCTGFTYYTSKKTAEHELDMLNSLGNNLCLKYIDTAAIPQGKRIENIACRSLCSQAV